ncbi:MAG: helix-turn-helix transcriptional regulator [Syntrophomonas sp.]
MSREGIAWRIRELRLANKKTQEEMAGVLGISRQAYIRLEKGARELAFVEIEKIANYLHVPYTMITGPAEDEEQSLSLSALCRSKGCPDDMLPAFQQVEKILGVFSAQERLYNRMREVQEKLEEENGE